MTTDAANITLSFEQQHLAFKVENALEIADALQQVGTAVGSMIPKLAEMNQDQVNKVSAVLHVLETIQQDVLRGGAPATTKHYCDVTIALAVAKEITEDKSADRDQLYIAQIQKPMCAFFGWLGWSQIAITRQQPELMGAGN